MPLCALTAMLLSVAAPKAVHATVAALVQVVNTTANPAVTLDAETSTRLPYQSHQTFNTLGGGYELFSINFADVPTGYRLVIQNVNSSFNEDPTGGLTDSDLVPNGYITTAFENKPFPSFAGSVSGGTLSTPSALINASITRYVGPGDTPIVNLSGVFYSSDKIGVTLTGYLENCAVTGCPAPVH